MPVFSYNYETHSAKDIKDYLESQGYRVTYIPARHLGEFRIE